MPLVGQRLVGSAQPYRRWKNCAGDILHGKTADGFASWLCEKDTEDAGQGFETGPWPKEGY